MTFSAAIAKLRVSDRLNFLATNFIPHRPANRLFARLSRIEQPWLARSSIALWQRFSGLDLSDAHTQRFKSLHACFTRRLKEGARPVDPDPRILVSPCDAIVGACGRIEQETLVQAKGFGYTLEELLRDPLLAAYYRHGAYATLRLTASMYHRFHAPYGGVLEQATRIAGATWNVNPSTVARIAKLYCRNERAILRMRLDRCGLVLTLVPVAAILVGGIRLCGRRLPSHFEKGEEIGWFEHGSTIIVIAPAGVVRCDGVQPGAVIRMGRPLMLLPKAEGLAL